MCAVVVTMSQTRAVPSLLPPMAIARPLNSLNDCGDAVGVAAERLAGGRAHNQVPDAHGLIGAAADGDRAAVELADCDRTYPAGVAVQRLPDRCASAQVPDAHGPQLD